MRLRQLVLIVGGCIIAGVLGLTVVPSPQYFAYNQRVGMIGGLGGVFECGGIQPTTGTRVYFDWSAPENITFDAWGCTGHRTSDGYSLNIFQVYQGNGTAGSASFVAQGGIYFFGTLCTAIGVPPPPCIASNVSGFYLGSMISSYAHFP